MRLCSKPEARVARRREGFTLLELVAVVFIITVLVSLLCAALDNTKAKALRISCFNNMRQLQLAWQVYTMENSERLPLNQADPGSPAKQLPAVSSSTNSWVAGNPRVDLNTFNIRKGSLYPYVGNVSAYRCPSDYSTVDRNPDVQRTRSYAMNAFLGGDQPASPAHPVPRMTTSDLLNPRPEKTFVFIEEHEESVWSSSFLVSPRSKLAAASVSWLSTPADRHQQGCNITFADGHAEYWKWYSPKADDADQQASGREMRDIRRLQNVVPAP
jgi:prepilin-type processing-associated H-X9-DG protein/prepilin-type N-terminal cleavage/methylation domain-containing protein